MTPRPTSSGQAVTPELEEGSVRVFTKALLKDLQALGRMLKEDLIRYKSALSRPVDIEDIRAIRESA